MHFLALLMLAIALSIDGFGVGLAYGIKKVRLRIHAVTAIAFSSAILMALAIFLGKFVAGFLPNHIERLLGGGILILIGLWQLFSGWKNYKLKQLLNTNEEENPVLLTIQVSNFRLVLNVLREPLTADLDKSGEISLKEAMLLGIALNIDAASAGVGAGIAGYPLTLVPTVAIMLFLAIYLGLYLGRRFTTGFIGEKGYMLPGTILTLMGLINVFKQ